MTNDQVPMTNQLPNDQSSNKTYDLEERTAKLGEDIIEFAKSIPKNSVTQPLIGQIVRAGTSVGANYCEADEAHSKKDFTHKIGICKKEARETRHWLRMIAKVELLLQNKAKKLWQEAQELNLIFAAIIRKSNKNG